MMLRYKGPDKFEVYFYHDGLIKFCSKPYVPPTADDYDPCAHITNLAVNGKVIDPSISPMKMWADVAREVLGRIRRARNERFSIRDTRNNKIVDRLREIVLFIGLAMKSEIMGKIRELNLDLEDRHYFHLLGMDLMFDESGNPNVLELNDRPSMIRRPVDNNEEQNIRLLEEELRLVFDRRIEDPRWEMLFPRPEKDPDPAMAEIANDLADADLCLPDETSTS
jgi:hypothetical protein